MTSLVVDITSGTPSPTEETTFTLNLAPANASSNGTTLENWTVTWGDGSSPTYIDLTNPTNWPAVGYDPVHNTVTHVYDSPATYVISATATDEYSHVANFEPTHHRRGADHVPGDRGGFVPDPSGFDVTFNRAAKMSAIHLYSSSDTHALYPSAVVVTGPTGKTVDGSLVWNAATNTASWVYTGGVLPPGNYSVTLLGSGSYGWQDVEYGYQLNAPTSGASGTNDTFPLHVASSSVPVVSLPDFACGPEQPVNVPAAYRNTSVYLGLPITISNGAGVTSVNLTMTFNPSLLDVTGRGGRLAGRRGGPQPPGRLDGQLRFERSGGTNRAYGHRIRAGLELAYHDL